MAVCECTLWVKPILKVFHRRHQNSNANAFVHVGPNDAECAVSKSACAENFPRGAACTDVNHVDAILLHDAKAGAFTSSLGPSNQPSARHEASSNSFSSHDLAAHLDATASIHHIADSLQCWSYLRCSPSHESQQSRCQTSQWGTAALQSKIETSEEAGIWQSPAWSWLKDCVLGCVHQYK